MTNNKTTSKNRQRHKKARHNPPPSFNTTDELFRRSHKRAATGLEPSDKPKPPLESPLKAHQDTVDTLTIRFPGNDLTTVKPQPVRWLWQKRLPLSGITLLDGDHGTGKSILALQIAACVSSGTPMPDGTPTIQGGVVIVSPYADATTTQLPILTALGADLERIEILSSIQEPSSDPHLSRSRPFSLPEDFNHLLDSIKHVNARLIILDPFITLLSRQGRFTDQRLGHLLIDLNQHLIAHNVACLLIRNCGAKGSHARPTVLERSDHFATIAISRLLLAPDPIQPDHLLLSHALSSYAAFTSTLILHIQPQSSDPDLPSITIEGTHTLRARDLMENRPDTLHRQFLCQHLQRIIANTPDPLPVATLYSLSPHSSIFQIQRSLNDLLRMDLILRPARGFYALAPDNPFFPPNATAATRPDSEPANQLNATAATRPDSEPANQLNATAATRPDSEPANQLNATAAIRPDSEPASQLNATTAIASDPKPANQLNATAAITSDPEPASTLKTTVATTQIQRGRTKAYREVAIV